MIPSEKPAASGFASDRAQLAQTMRRAVLRLSGVGRALLDLVLPPLCVACRAPVMSHGLVCGACWGKIGFISHPLCDRLGLPLPYGSGRPLVSAAALASPPVYDRARAVARFDGVMRELVHGLKFHDRHEGLPLFARWLRHAGAELLEEADLLLPVPLHRSRLWSRRFNQAALLAQHLSRQTGIETAVTLLVRVRPTRQQVGLSMAERRSNVADAFEIAPGQAARIRGRKIVLIDDVITTGATANACAHVLKRARAARVDLLALARVTDPLRCEF